MSNKTIEQLNIELSVLYVEVVIAIEVLKVHKVGVEMYSNNVDKWKEKLNELSKEIDIIKHKANVKRIIGVKV